MLKGRSVMNLYELKEQGYGYRRISEVTGLSRNTVRKYLRDGGARSFHTRTTRPSKLDPFRPIIEERVKSGLHSVPAIMNLIVPLGYEGKETIVRDYVRSIKPPRTKRNPPIRRFETAPGEQLQFDWGVFSYVDRYGKDRNIAGLACVLGFSRRIFVRFSHSCDIYGLIECLIAAFSYFEGVTNAVLTDHMKTVVIGGDRHSGYIYNSRLEDFAGYLGISIRLARVRRPETKGKVERAIKTVKENFWPTRSFSSLADLNLQAISWCQDHDRRIHRSIGMPPMEAFVKEANCLRPLPPRERLDPFIARSRRVSPDGFVSFAGISYGVPIKYARDTVLIYPREHHLEITTSDHLPIATHSLRFKTRTIVYLPHSYTDLGQIHKIMERSKPHGIQIPEVTVEHRPLSFYQELADA